MTDHPKREEPRWRPKNGPITIEDSILERIQRALCENIDYDTCESGPTAILSFPGTTPLPLAVEAFATVALKQANNILTHTRQRDEASEQGFPGTQQLEREVIDELARLCGATNPEKTIDGYLCAGGTTSILEGMWIAREQLRKQLVNRDQTPKIIALTAITTHYAARKACQILDIQQVRVGLDEQHRFSVEQLRQALDQSYANGVRGFIVVATAGCSVLGVVDNIRAIADTLDDFRIANRDSATYLHIDAAFGGMILPFTNPPITGWGFDVEGVDSITIDPHKANVPYPAGVFLCRKGRQGAVDHIVPYVNNHKDDTVEGSRSGAAAAACWAALQYSDYERIVQGCMATKTHFIHALGSLGCFDVISGETTIFAISLREDLPEATQEAILACFESKIEHKGEIVKRYILSSDLLPHDMSTLASDTNPCRTWWKIVVMPHVTRTVIDRFVADLQQIVTMQSVVS